MNILYIGSSGALSLIPFKKLLASGHTVSAVGVFDPVTFNEKIIALENESLALAANQANIPVIDLSQPVCGIQQQCEKLSVDVIIMSCYGKRLSDEIIQCAPQGCFNMHPALLPGFRGPEPIFWQMKYGADPGVSWHHVTHDFDAGDIVIQKKVYIEDGATHSDISERLAVKGAELLDKLLADLGRGELTCIPQDDEIASYQNYPQAQDFVIDTGFSAQHNYNFMCATQAFGYPYHYRYGRHSFMLEQVLTYDNNASLESPEVQGDRLYIPCNDGVLITTCTDKISP